MGSGVSFTNVLTRDLHHLSQGNGNSSEATSFSDIASAPKSHAKIQQNLTEEIAHDSLLSLKVPLLENPSSTQV